VGAGAGVRLPRSTSGKSVKAYAALLQRHQLGLEGRSLPSEAQRDIDDYYLPRLEMANLVRRVWSHRRHYSGRLA